MTAGDLCLHRTLLGVRPSMARSRFVGDSLEPKELGGPGVLFPVPKKATTATAKELGDRSDIFGGSGHLRSDDQTAS